MSVEPGTLPAPPRGTLDRLAMLDDAASVILVIIGWVGAAGVLGTALLPMMFLDDCLQPACHVPRAVHVYYVGVALTLVVAYVVARWALRPRGRRRWPFALLASAVCLWCACASLFVVYRALDVHPEYFQQQQLR